MLISLKIFFMVSRMVEEYDVIVVGAGVAGLTAALYLSRQGLRTLVISRDIGGQLLMAGTIENYPGIESIDGAGLAMAINRQIETFGAITRYGDVVNRIERLDDGRFKVSTDKGASYICEAIVLAFGKIPKRMGIDGEDEYDGRGVSYCAICDGPLYKGKVTAVVGYGNQGLDAVLLLSELSPKIYYVTHTRLFGDEEYLERVKALDNVEVLEYHEPVRVLGDGNKVTGMIVRDKRGGEERRIDVDGIFVELGYEAKSDFIRDLVELNEKGEIETNKLGETSVPGIFAAGDITDIPYKQAVISAGQASIAALSAFNYIQRRRGRKGGIIGDWRKTGKVEKREPKLGFKL